MARADLLSRARAGDEQAFRALTEPHRRELQVHCYRMLGSFHDAEEAIQDTMLAAWRGLERFDGRSALRTWLYRIATNRCLDALRAIRRRPAIQWDVPGIDPPEPSRTNHIPWLEPYPDALLDSAISVPLGPEARYEQTESISLAFVTALQILPPRQLAVLLLRDVLGFQADEVAGLLDMTIDAVKSSLKRARAGMLRHLPDAPREQPPAGESPAEDAIVTRFVSAYESADIDALVALLTDEVFVSMPPIAIEYHGRDIVGRFFDLVFRAGHRYALVRTSANGQPAFGVYRQTPRGLHAAGLFVLTLSAGGICAITRFAPTLLPAFGLARLPANAPAGA
jgi:RNA polymerase sigma-70 factor (ECF subfamily)